MVVKIFYVVIVVFSIAMVFLVSQDPYYSDDLKYDFNLSNVRLDDVKSYEIDDKMVVGIYGASVINRYSQNDEFMQFYASKINNNLIHNLSSNKAERFDDRLVLSGDVYYENNQSVKFNSQSATYDIDKKIVFSDSDFSLMQNGDKMVGKSVEYNIQNKQIRAKGTKIWLEQR